MQSNGIMIKYLLHHFVTLIDCYVAVSGACYLYVLLLFFIVYNIIISNKPRLLEHNLIQKHKKRLLDRIP